MQNTRIESLMARLAKQMNVDPYGDLTRVHTGSRLVKALSPRYIVNKLSQWLYERRHPDHPWLTRDAIALLAAHIGPGQRGFEWGSGNGSRWFAKRSASLVSVEHNSAWYTTVRQGHTDAGITNVDYRFVEEPHYTAVIDEFADESFDYVLVDGLFRDQAFLKSIPKLKPGGWIIFDNANWYLPSDSKTPHSRSRLDGPASALFGKVAEQTAAWTTYWTSNGVNDTAIFIKPENESVG